MKAESGLFTILMPDPYSLITYEMVTGASMDERVSYMQMKLEQNLARGDKVVDLVGFSRGGASALDFLNRIQDEISRGNPLYQGIEMRFVGIFDAVPSKRSEGVNMLKYANAYEDNAGNGRQFRFRLPSGMKFTFRPIHAVSLDEQRDEFKVVDIRGALQVGFRGVHSNVGGGYPDDPFAWIPLAYVARAGLKAHVPFDMDVLAKEKQLHDWNAKSFDNSEIYYNDNEPRNLPKAMLLHPSVRLFTTTPKNEIGNYPYLKDWYIK